MRLVPEQIAKIAIRCPNWVGDIVMATPLLDCIRRGFPNARITGIIKRRFQGIIKDGPWFDDTLDCEDKTWSGFWRMAHRLHQGRFDLGIVLPNSIRSVLPLWLGRVRQVYGYRTNGRDLFMTDGPRARRVQGRIEAIPTVQYYLHIARWLELDCSADAKPRLYIGQGLQLRAQALLRELGIGDHELVIGLNPGAGFGPSKCWPTSHFARLAELCQHRLGAKVMLFCGPGEEPIARAIVDNTRANVFFPDPATVDLEMLKPMIRRCDLLVSNDTGPRHVAVALDVPVVVLMGPIDPGYTNAYLDRSIVIRKDLDCSPCYKRICPRQHECMTQITAEEVFEATQRLLGRYRRHDGTGSL